MFCSHHFSSSLQLGGTSQLEWGLGQGEGAHMIYSISLIKEKAHKEFPS